MKSETWKPVDGFEGYYEVSNRGRVRSVDRITTARRRVSGKVLAPSVNLSGYETVRLCNGDRVSRRRVSRLVALAFIENPDGFEQVNHINGIKTDNRVQNLEWCTPSQNIVHAVKNGLFGPSKLNEQQVRVIRRCVEQGMVQHEVGSVFGVQQPIIGKIHRRESWAHVSHEKPLVSFVK